MKPGRSRCCNGLGCGVPEVGVIKIRQGVGDAKKWPGQVAASTRTTVVAVEVRAQDDSKPVDFSPMMKTITSDAA